MTRISFYTIHCTTEERDNGIEHHERFTCKSQAVKRAREVSPDEFVAVEKHIEIYERYDWIPHHALGDDWMEVVSF